MGFINKKIEWVSGLRGLAILAVVLGHMTTPWSRHLYSWHLPLLFFLSGYLIKDTDWKRSMLKDGKYVLKVILVFGILGIISEVIKRILMPNYSFSVPDFNIKEDLFGLFWWMDESKIKSYGLILWFLPAWFWGKSLVKLLSNYLGIWIMGIVVLLLWIWMSNNKILLPLGIDKGLLVAFWIGMGMIFKKVERFFIINIWSSMILGLLIMVSLVPLINLSIKWVEPIGLATYYPIMVILFWIGLVKKMEWFNRLFGWWGDRSMWIYLIHVYVNNVTYLLRFGDVGWVVQFAGSILMLYLLLKLIDYVKTTRYAGFVNWV